MESYEGPDMVYIPRELSVHESKIMPVFRNESMFNANKDHRYCHLEKYEQIIKPNSCGRG